MIYMYMVFRILLLFLIIYEVIRINVILPAKHVDKLPLADRILISSVCVFVLFFFVLDKVVV